MTGRLVSKDPTLFNGGTTNLYEYSLNDPVNFKDNDGKGPILGYLCALGAAFDVNTAALLVYDYYQTEINQLEQLEVGVTCGEKQKINQQISSLQVEQIAASAATRTVAQYGVDALCAFLAANPELP